MRKPAVVGECRQQVERNMWKNYIDGVSVFGGRSRGICFAASEPDRWFDSVIEMMMRLEKRNCGRWKSQDHLRHARHASGTA